MSPIPSLDPRRPAWQACLLSLLAAVVTLGPGCRSVGPATIPHDRFSYSEALADSWKSQMLLNIVKTRYLDLPIYLDVGQIVSGYTLETTGNVGGGLSGGNAPGSVGNVLQLGASARFADSPTITYTPLTGGGFLEGFLTPIDPSRVFALVQSGYAADFVLELAVDSLNGLRNRQVTVGSRHAPDPDFFRAVTLLRELQDDAALGVRLERASNGVPATVLFFRSERARDDVRARIAEVQRLLGIDPAQATVRIVSTRVQAGDGALGMATRSLYQMLAALSLGVEVPPRHVERRLTPPIPGESDSQVPLLRIQSGPKPPPEIFVAVPYEGQWFWVAQDDWRSKRTFSSILFLFTLANPGSAANVPTLTIPTR